MSLMTFHYQHALWSHQKLLECTEKETSFLVHTNTDRLIATLTQLFKIYFKKIKRGELHIRNSPDVTLVGARGLNGCPWPNQGIFFTLSWAVHEMVKEDTSYSKANTGSPCSCHLRGVQPKWILSLRGHTNNCNVHITWWMWFCWFSHALSTYMVTDGIITASAHLSVEYIPDFSVQEALNQVLCKVHCI